MDIRLKGDWGIAIGDVVKTKKNHPCGSNIWTVLREGAEIRFQCNSCGRIVIMTRKDFIKNVKTVIIKGPDISKNEIPTKTIDE